jgi:hypothetical protein
MLSSSVARQLIHTREIKTQAFRREDGLWDIEASLIDTKAKDFPLASGVKLAGNPIHHMILSLVIDDQFNILAASAKAQSVPYVGYCDKIEPAYEKLVGLNLVNGFRSAVKERFAGILGCSHMTELSTILPTAAIQAFAGEVIKVADHGTGEMPFQLNRCHALRTDGDAVKKYHPTWFGAPLNPKDIPKKSS